MCFSQPNPTSMHQVHAASIQQLQSDLDRQRRATTQANDALAACQQEAATVRDDKARWVCLHAQAPAPTTGACATPCAVRTQNMFRARAMAWRCNACVVSVDGMLKEATKQLETWGKEVADSQTEAARLHASIRELTAQVHRRLTPPPR